ncbi:polyamine aminopropyltransferase [Halosimplex salinum]|uniref:polyamine aminopropyltransferase n=1 Tax=Halosimplex salinum TaxID=1710538 RepID=UPI000F47A253|nr:polyamine aminopropyltransferase [Halosimplex salinum]
MTYDDTRTHWFANYHSESMYQYVRSDPVHVEETEFQNLSVLDTDQYGRIMALNGEIQIAEDSDACVHEPMVHPGLLTHPDPRNVLVIGGGDGASSREIVKHPVSRVDVIELDERVVEICREYFPSFASGLEDDRVSLHFRDGLEFVRSTDRRYDVILLDISDPQGPAQSVFTREFYNRLAEVLQDDGLIVTHCESPDSSRDVFYRINATLDTEFPVTRPYRHWVPAYIDFWGRTIASKVHDPREMTVSRIADRLETRSIETEWLTPELCHAMFRSLNKQVQDTLDEDWEPITKSNPVEFERP